MQKPLKSLKWLHRNRLGSKVNVSGSSWTALDETDDTTSNNGEDKTGEDTLIGSCLEVKRVDEHQNSFSNEWIPSDSKVPGRRENHLVRMDKDKYNRFAFTVVQQFKKLNGEEFLFKTLLDIKSSQLKKACEEVIGNVQGISWVLSPLRVSNTLFFLSP